jgi:hypothetical protein
MATGKLTNIGHDDWIAVALTTNQAYEVTIIGAAAEIAIASFLSAYSANSIPASLVGVSPAGTQYMDFMPSVSGTYYSAPIILTCPTPLARCRTITPSAPPR